jgi:hypothetical protein
VKIRKSSIPFSTGPYRAHDRYIGNRESVDSLGERIRGIMFTLHYKDGSVSEYEYQSLGEAIGRSCVLLDCSRQLGNRIDVFCDSKLRAIVKTIGINFMEENQITHHGCKLQVKILDD